MDVSGVGAGAAAGAQTEAGGVQQVPGVILLREARVGGGASTSRALPRRGRGISRAVGRARVHHIVLEVGASRPTVWTVGPLAGSVRVVEASRRTVWTRRKICSFVLRM